ncbi:hypothetical protein ABIE37_000157 [Arthrobacter bambusae]|uniref:Restriction endonuclease type IV Mrr domain-containing protein n=1 Tax=Arthrobacter bambusae TaxID=1338426 RepID=A0ABV2P0W3_9MICC
MNRMPIASAGMNGRLSYSEPGLLIIEARDRESRDCQLEHATELLKNSATDCGILVTRHGFKTFTAKLSPDVEFGLIQELDLL